MNVTTSVPAVPPPDWADHLWALVGMAVASPMDVLGLFLLAMLCWILARAQFDKNSKVDLTYLLVDSQVGNVTLAKFAGFGAFLASTWVFIDLAVTNHFDTGYAFVYVGSWAASKVATDFMLRGRDGGSGGG